MVVNLPLSGIWGRVGQIESRECTFRLVLVEYIQLRSHWLCNPDGDGSAQVSMLF